MNIGKLQIMALEYPSFWPYLAVMLTDIFIM